MRRAPVVLAVTIVGAVMAALFVVLAPPAIDRAMYLLPYGCTLSDRDFGERLAREAAVDELLVRYPPHEEPQHGCDDDDRTVSVDVEVATGENEQEALRASWRRSFAVCPEDRRHHTGEILRSSG